MVIRAGVVVGSALLAFVLAGCSVPGLWVYEPAGASTGTGTGTATDPAAYADEIWASKVVPTITEKAVDATTLLPAIDADATAAGEQYGVPSVSGGAPTFMVKGSGTVTEVDTEDPQGPVTVDLGDGQTIRITTGPVITGTALRDAMQIGFGEFTNQLDYQNVGTALNNKAKTEVIGKVDVAGLEGRTLGFEGAFAATNSDGVLVVPTVLTVS
jgi:predicted lipoprotein